LRPREEKCPWSGEARVKFPVMVFLPYELVVGFALAVAFLANAPMRLFVEKLRKESGVTLELPPSVPPWIVGTSERLLSFALFYFCVENRVTILALWIGAKLAANWQRRGGSQDTEPARQIRARTFIALMGGTVSVAIGAAAGAIARYYFEP
jgi:hypothetical protein